MTDTRNLATSVGCSIVVEAYNLTEGHSWARLDRAAQAAKVAARHAPNGPHEVLLVTTDEQGAARSAFPADDLLRHVVVRSRAGYDEMKREAVTASRGVYVVFLDGDCNPDGPAEEWLESLTAPLLSRTATAVGGLTLYDGDTPLSLASSLMDFGFLADGVSDVLGCYASNNVAFLREKYLASPVPISDLRCACYEHAQLLLRQGDPVRLAAGARVRHELPPFFAERLRRGRDVVAAALADPWCQEARLVAGGGLKALARWYRVTLGWDRRRFHRLRRLHSASAWKWWSALALVPVLRVVDTVGVAFEMRRRDRRPEIREASR